eukprot:3859452-Rhodomonas_salina.2
MANEEGQTDQTAREHRPRRKTNTNAFPAHTERSSRLPCLILQRRQIGNNLSTSLANSSFASSTVSSLASWHTPSVPC